MRLINESISIDELKIMSERMFGNMVKGVVDIEKGLLSLDAEMHADLEAFFLENGSSQNNLWGINLYPDNSKEDFIEFDSMINIKPSQGNRSRGVEDESIRIRILQIVEKKVSR